MNRPIILAVVLAAATLLASCGEPATPVVAPDTALQHAQKHLDPTYQCPMHPDVRSSEPGQCPICGMNLVLVEPAAAMEQDKQPLYYRHPHNPTITSPVWREDLGLPRRPRSALRPGLRREPVTSARSRYGSAGDRGATRADGRAPPGAQG